MKKKLFGTMVVVAAMFAGYSAYDAQSEREMTEVALANVEALAQNKENTSSTGDTGPGEMVDCKGWGTGSRKECMCRLSEVCTPTSCK